MIFPDGFKRDMRRTAASVARLKEIKDVTDEDADRIRLVWYSANWSSLRLAYPELGVSSSATDSFRPVLRECVDRLLRTHGVCLLVYSVGRNIPVYYCNSGDTYASTVLFWGHHMRVGCIGDLIEHNRVTQPVQL